MHKKIFIELSEKNHKALAEGKVIYKRLTDPSLRNELIQIVTEQYADNSVSKKTLGEQLEQLHKENPNFIVSPVILKQSTVDNIRLHNYCWTVMLTEFELFILSEKSFNKYKKNGFKALDLLSENVTYRFDFEDDQPMNIGEIKWKKQLD